MDAERITKEEFEKLVAEAGGPALTRVDQDTALYAALARTGVASAKCRTPPGPTHHDLP